MVVYRSLRLGFLLLAVILLGCGCEEMPALAEQQVDQQWLLQKIKSLNEHVEQLANVALKQQEEINKLKSEESKLESEDVYIHSITEDLKNGNTKRN